MPDKLQALYEASFTSKTVKLNAKKISSVFTANPIPDHLYYKFVKYFNRSDWQNRNFFTTDVERFALKYGKELAEEQTKFLEYLAGESIQPYTANGFDASQDNTVICSTLTRGNHLEIIIVWVDAQSMDTKPNEERAESLHQILVNADDNKPEDWMDHISKLLIYVQEQQNIIKAQTKHTDTHGINLADL